MAALNDDGVRSAAAYLDRWLEFRRRYLRLPGIQAAVLHDAELVLSTAHGHADVEAGIPLTQRHLFRIASHSKTFTATAILQLAERRRLRLDDRLEAWLPWLAGSPLADRTLRELLAHGAGVLRDGENADFWQLHRPFPDSDELREVARAAEVLPANERFKYSNVGYALLGLVVAAAAETPWADYVRAEIVERLGLHSTGPDLEDERAGEYAAGYSALAYADERLPIEHVPTNAFGAATGFYSTAEDLCLYASAHFHGDERLLSDASKRLLQREEWKVEGAEEHYGLGFSVHDVGGRRLVGHGGGYPGHGTQTLLDPADRLVVTVLVNAIDAPSLALANTAVRLVDLACGHPLEDGADAGELDRFCGRFANLWGALDVVRLGGRLYALSPAVPDPVESPTELEVADEATLNVVRTVGYGAPGERLRFSFGADGRVRQLRGAGGMTLYPFDAYAAAAAGARRVTVGASIAPTDDGPATR